MGHILVNGTRRGEDEAVIRVSDRGFRFGDGVFETIPIHCGLPYLWDYHRERLEDGLQALAIACDTQDMLVHSLALIKANDLKEGLLRIQVSRGEGGRGYLPASAMTPTVIMETAARPRAPQSVTLWLSHLRKISPDALPTRFKLAHGLNSTLALMEAAGHGCDNALQLDADGRVSEAASANIFWRRDDRLYTPSLACGTLAGVTRRRLIELSPYPVSEGEYGLADLASANEVILTNAATGATAVTKLLPEGKIWESTALEQEINHLRDQDINHNLQRLRESLAQS